MCFTFWEFGHFVKEENPAVVIFDVGFVYCLFVLFSLSIMILRSIQILCMNFLKILYHWVGIPSVDVALNSAIWGTLCMFQVVWLLHITLPWTFVHNVLWDLKFTFSGINVQEPDHWVVWFMFSSQNDFPEWLCHLHYHQQCMKEPPHYNIWSFF